MMLKQMHVLSRQEENYVYCTVLGAPYCHYTGLPCPKDELQPLLREMVVPYFCIKIYFTYRVLYTTRL